MYQTVIIRDTLLNDKYRCVQRGGVAEGCMRIGYRYCSTLEAIVDTGLRYYISPRLFILVLVPVLSLFSGFCSSFCCLFLFSFLFCRSYYCFCLVLVLVVVLNLCYYLLLLPLSSPVCFHLPQGKPAEPPVVA